MQEIIIIAAMAENRVIGKDNTLPWSLKEDMAHFRELTKGFPCIMGRKTWESLPIKPLPGRLNIVITSSPEITGLKKDSNVKIFSSLPAAIEYCAGSFVASCAGSFAAISACYEKIFICGGETIYRQALPLANKIELTLIHKQYEGDTFFPEIDSSIWTITKTVKFDTFSFLTYTKKSLQKESIL
jgi:dihydrofolate reductase